MLRGKQMADVYQFIIGALIGGLICASMIAVVQIARYQLWLRNFRRESKIAKGKWEVECRAHEARWEAETAEWLRGWK